MLSMKLSKCITLQNVISHLCAPNRCCFSYYFDYERAGSVLHNSKWLQRTGIKSTETFIPVTRKQMIETIMEDPILVESSKVEVFKIFSNRVDSILNRTNKKRLKDLKSLYNPISPDRDTIQMKTFTAKQLYEREEQALKVVSQLLLESNFYELPRDIIWKTLSEVEETEKLNVNVNMEMFAVLKMWVIGMDVAPIDTRSFYNQTKERQKKRSSQLDPQNHTYHDNYFVKKKLKKLRRDSEHVHRIERYKRVIIAFREHGKQKLHLKAFKDLPCDNLEFLLPGGKINMRGIDVMKLASAATVLLLIYGIGILTTYKMQTSLVVLTTSLIVLFRSWIIYGNIRRKYILNVSKTLYFKNVANNYALLSLIADRSEDEQYKAILLVSAFLSKITEFESIDKKTLEQNIQTWLLDRFDVTVKFDAELSLLYLQNQHLLERKNINNGVFSTIDLAAITKEIPFYGRDICYSGDLFNEDSQQKGEEEKESDDKIEEVFFWK